MSGHDAVWTLVRCAFMASLFWLLLWRAPDRSVLDTAIRLVASVIAFIAAFAVVTYK